MGDPDAQMGVFSKGLVHREYETMTSWWCSQPALSVNSPMCARRTMIQSVKGMSPEAKAAALKAKGIGIDPAKDRKAMSDEAKRMVEAYCKRGGSDGSLALGATTTICARTLGVLEMGKR